jgi:hypothetical protein
VKRPRLIAIDRMFLGLSLAVMFVGNQAFMIVKSCDSDQLASTSLPLFSPEKFEIAKQSGQLSEPEPH